MPHVFRTDMIGAAAAERLLQSLCGITLHRRGLKWQHLFLDTHYRMSDEVMCQGQVDMHYVQTLGMELASMDRAIFDGLVAVIQRIVMEHMPAEGGFADCPMLLSDIETPELFRHVQGTLFFGLVRNFMGKFVNDMLLITVPVLSVAMLLVTLFVTLMFRPRQTDFFECVSHLFGANEHLQSCATDGVSVNEIDNFQ